nr:cobalamin-dependent protein [Kiritimatiellia bacterium]
SGEKTAVKGRIVLATVKGDIHDIGKNICRALLENYGFKVIDLGRDVPPEKVVEAARREKARLVGLSALMTTTVGFMEETVKLVHAELPGCMVTVGGAVLTADYAEKMGADHYSKDAMGLVRYAEKLFGS